MTPLARTLRSVPRLDRVNSEVTVNPEWLVTNGLGGYASGTISGAVTRRYHGLLVAALAAPLGRMVMLSGLTEEIYLPPGRLVAIGPRHEGRENIAPPALLVEFRLETGLPVWRYRIDRWTFEKIVYMPYRQNTVHVTYRWLAAPADAELRLRPLIQFREHETPVHFRPNGSYVLTVWEDQYEVSARELPPLRMLLRGRGEFVIERKNIEHFLYPVEQLRGYESIGALWTPGAFHVPRSGETEITFTASTESWEVIRALPPAEALAAERERRDRLIASAHPKARTGVAAELVIAADQFIVTPAARLADAARVYASGDDMRTIIAGYHWFTDWGRDTMISLEGLTLVTSRFLEAAWILRTFANAIRDGLIPNLFPERSREGLYHTADATLWFFHAIDRYVQATGDRWTLRLLLPKLIDIVAHHVRGTRFGIGADPEDGLLRQGAHGYPLTWMDAKVGDWVVTPRRGKAVEINALWYNALRLLQQWFSEEGDRDRSEAIRGRADQVMRSFNERFWYASEGYLYDVIDGEKGDDSSCRPNQLLAISLPHPVLHPSKWKAVLDTVCRRLLTPVGLRSLAPGHPDYKAKYFGDLRARDAAYHQGTVWPWLIGPLIDASLKVYPEDRARAHALLQGFVGELDQGGVGTISEIFDAEKPQLPRGCIAQAWSVAEVLRCWLKTAPWLGRARSEIPLLANRSFPAVAASGRKKSSPAKKRNAARAKIWARIVGTFLAFSVRKRDEGGSMPDAFELIREDHRKVKELFDRFDNADESAEKREIVQEALKELKMHAAVEEEILYPAIRDQIGDSEMVDKALEEHHLVKTIIPELERMRPDDERYDAKFKVLCESVNHHIEEEESQVLREVESSLDGEELGTRIEERKQRLLRSGARTAAGRSRASARGRRKATRRQRQAR